MNTILTHGTRPIVLFAVTLLSPTLLLLPNLRAQSNHPPTVILHAPTNGAVFIAPAEITLAASAQDQDGFLTIRTVEFFAGTTRLGITTNVPTLDPRGPFVMTWRGAPPGQYVLTARVLDDVGSAATSAAVNISVWPTNASVVSIEATEVLATEQPDYLPNFNSAWFTVSRKRPDGEPQTHGTLSVFFNVSGTASNGVDYERVFNHVFDAVHFTEGDSRASILITPLDDVLREGTETVNLTLQPSPPSFAPNWYVIGAASNATAYILDDETPPPVVTIEAADSIATEPPTVIAALDTARFVIRRTGELRHPIDLWCAVSGTASNGVDYQPMPSRVSLPAGSNQAYLTVIPMDDALVEGTETIDIQLMPLPPGSPVGLYTLGHPYSATAFLQDNEPEPVDWVLGLLRKEVYLDIPGLFLTNLTHSPKFPEHPDRTEWLPSFEIPLELGELNNYGARVSGFLLPLETGLYTFYLSSDDQGELYLSSDADPARKVVIAVEPGWSGPRTWTGPASGRTNSENISAPIQLEAGRAYYVEALMKEGGGGDHLGVAWQRPGDPVPANGSPPISGEFLGVPASWFATNQPPTVTMLSPTNGATFSAGSDVLLGATAGDPDGGPVVVEFFAGSSRLGQANGPFQTPFGEWLLTWSNVPPGTHVLSARAADAQGASATSSPVTITVLANATTVTSTADSGSGSLRAVLASAPFGSTITFAVTGAVTLTSGELRLANSLHLAGPGADRLTIQRSSFPGTPAFRLFRVEGSARLSGLTVRGGRINESDSYVDGAGILNQGSLLMDDCVVSDHAALGEYSRGGAICNQFGATLIARRSTFARNAASAYYGEGGAIYNYGTLAVTNCTFSGNSVGMWGGAIHNDMLSGGAAVDSCTFTANSAGFGGGIFNRGAPPHNVSPVFIRNTILVGNTGYDIGHCSLIQSGGYNLIGEIGDPYGSMALPFVSGPGDHTNVPLTAVRLGPLQLNDGATPTHALGRHSLALDCGPLAGFPATDQRGVPRPFGARCDIGAYEADTLPPNTAPTVGCPPDSEWQAGPSGTATGTLSATVQDDEGDALVVVWTVDGVAAGTNTIPGPTIQTVATLSLSLTLATGLHHIAVSASDGEALAECATTVAVLPSLGPTITQQPASLRIFLDQSATFSVAATGTPPLGYQWLFNGSPIPTATQASFTRTNVQLADAGDYRAVVSNAWGAVTSTVATLIVLPPRDGPGSLDLTFDPTGGWQYVGPTCEAGRVVCVAQQPDGRTLIGGTFVGVNGRPRNRIARLLANGTLDESFDPGRGVDGTVEDIAVQSDGRILLVGGFTSFNGLACSGVVRVGPDGALDPSFAPPVLSPSEGAPACAAVQSDGRILVGGNFRQVNGEPRLALARFNADGSLDARFNANAVMSADFATVRSIQIQPDGKILVAGFFTVTDRPLLRLNPDGSADPSFQLPEIETHAGSNIGWVFSMSLDSAGRIVIVGQFERVNGAECSLIARLNPQGTLDLSFAPAAVVGHHPLVMRAAHQPDGRILFGGQFTHVGGFERRGIARLLPTGAVDSSFDPGQTFGTPEIMAWINDLAVAGEGRVVVAAGAEPYSCCPVVRPVCRLNPNGSLDAGFGTPAVAHPAALSVIATQPDGKLLVSMGSGCTYNGQSRAPITRLNANGTLDATFTAGFSADGVSVIVVQPDGKLLVGGTIFKLPDGRLMRGLARLRADGSIDPTFAVELSPIMDEEGDGFYISDLLPQPEGRIVVVGSFQRLRGAARRCIARLQADGSLDESFNFVPPGPLDFGEYTLPIHCAALEAEGRVLIAASFADAGMRLLRLNATGAIETELLESASLGMVNRIIVEPDRKILVAGSMHFGIGEDWTTLIRLEPNGSFDPGFTPMLNTQLNALALQEDGKILISYNSGGPALARLRADGTLDGSFVADIRSGIWPGYVNRIVLQRDGQVVVGGSFSSVSGLPWHGIARLHNDVQVSASFVVREIAAGGKVRLVASPAAQVNVYAVEDQPPSGWPVTDISHGGIFDAKTGKVKFGPYFDHESRMLSYRVLPPPGAQGVFTFAGTASADGVNSPITGDQQFVVASWHPAEVRQTQPADWQMSIEEVTAYASAWRRGLDWIVPPNPIPMDYVTRAGTLWRAGECYTVNPAITNPPLWWVPCDSTPAPKDGGGLQPSGRIERRASPLFVPGESQPITLDVRPAARTTAYAVEEHYPAGWQIEMVSHEGVADIALGVVRWGPFFDATPRQLSYRLTAPLSAGGVAELSGRGSFDGLGVSISGGAQMWESCRLAAAPEAASGAVRLTLTGRDGVRYRIEASADLEHWIPVASAICGQGRLMVSDPEASLHPLRFYRAVAE